MVINSDRLNDRELERLFPGDSELARRMRGFDWSTTDLGAPETWSVALKTSVRICLTSRFPIVIYWGSELVVLYNDAYAGILANIPGHSVCLAMVCGVKFGMSLPRCSTK